MLLNLPRGGDCLAVPVLVFRVNLLDELGRFQGYTLEVDDYVPHLLAPGNSHFASRAETEADENYKQIIPYVVVRHNNQVLSYVRGRRSDESKLVAKRSIGFGGHVQMTDWTLFSDPGQLVLDTAAREIREELGLDNVAPDLTLVGLINDDSDAVGRTHFGFAYSLTVRLPEVLKREGPITQLRFIDLAKAKALGPELEGWSRIVLDMLLDPRLVKGGRG